MSRNLKLNGETWNHPKETMGMHGSSTWKETVQYITHLKYDCIIPKSCLNHSLFCLHKVWKLMLLITFLILVSKITIEQIYFYCYSRDIIPGVKLGFMWKLQTKKNVSHNTINIHLTLTAWKKAVLEFFWCIFSCIWTEHGEIQSMELFAMKLLTYKSVLDLCAFALEKLVWRYKKSSIKLNKVNLN